jgi:hypothetical protein
MRFLAAFAGEGPFVIRLGPVRPISEAVPEEDEIELRH